jgi:hypothetical protein
VRFVYVDEICHGTSQTPIQYRIAHWDVYLSFLPGRLHRALSLCRNFGNRIFRTSTDPIEIPPMRINTDNCLPSVTLEVDQTMIYIDVAHGDCDIRWRGDIILRRNVYKIISCVDVSSNFLARRIQWWQMWDNIIMMGDSIVLCGLTANEVGGYRVADTRRSKSILCTCKQVYCSEISNQLTSEAA